jgi:hypothetical protein
VQIDKNQILELLRSRGDEQQAQEADRELPQQVDTDQHADLLSRFGLDPQELLSKLGGLGGGGLGGGGLGGLGGLLGGER